MSLVLEEQKDRTTRLKVEKAVYQYQIDDVGDRWIVRYDYLSYPTEPHPGMHVQVRGAFHEAQALPPGRTLERVHFPTGRVSIEAVIRMLVEQFDIPTNTPAEVWRPVFAESERAFLEVARRGISGPSA